MFEHIGRELDPGWRLRSVVAALLLGASSAGSWAAAQGALSVSVLVMDAWDDLFGARTPPPPPPPPPDTTPPLIEIVLADPELTADMLPSAPLGPPPAPPLAAPSPASAPTEAAPSAPSAEVEPAPLAPIEPEPALVDAAEPDPTEGGGEPGDGPTDLLLPDRDTLDDWRRRGLLALRRPEFQRLEGQEVDLEGWDGIFGPRDLPLLAQAVAAQEERRRAAAAAGGGYRLQAGFVGGGLAGALQVMRMPPSRELATAAEPWFPDEARPLVLEPVSCVTYAWVDGLGLPTEVEVVRCPPELSEAALEAAWSTRWQLAADLSERARVKLEIHFDPALKPSRDAKRRWRTWPARKAQLEADLDAKQAGDTP